MANFLTRVELHNASLEDYDPLHDEMAARGFLRTIRGPEGKEYRLPHGNYMSADLPSSQDALFKAKEAVDAIRREGGIVVTPALGGCWNGLREVIKLPVVNELPGFLYGGLRLSPV